MWGWDGDDDIVMPQFTSRDCFFFQRSSFHEKKKRGVEGHLIYFSSVSLSSQSLFIRKQERFFFIAIIPLFFAIILFVFSHFAVTSFAKKCNEGKLFFILESKIVRNSKEIVQKSLCNVSHFCNERNLQRNQKLERQRRHRFNYHLPSCFVQMSAHMTANSLSYSTLVVPLRLSMCSSLMTRAVKERNVEEMTDLAMILMMREKCEDTSF